MAKAKLNQLPVEVAQIIFYIHGSEVAHLVRYADMKLAKAQFVALVKAREAGKPMTLTGANGTTVVPNAGNICSMTVCDSDITIFFATEQQKRFNARMQAQ